MTQWPSEFLDRIKKVRPDDFESLLLSLSEPQVTSIRLHSLKGRVADFESAENISWCKSGRYLIERPYFTHDPLIHAGGYYVQEASSMFLEQIVASFLKNISQPFILDLCAAPGGKSTHLLSLMEGKGLLVSNEIVPNRNAVLRENITKWGYANVVVTQNEAVDFAKSNLLFDAIVVDAPCSGEGMFRKDKNAISEWSISNVENCVVRQKNILEDIVKALKPGGLLVYSTCTFEPDENINQMHELLRGGEFEPYILADDFTSLGVEKIERYGAFGFSFYPHKVRGEGFFISALVKKGDLISEASSQKLKSVKTSDALHAFFRVEHPPVVSFKEAFHLVTDEYGRYMDRLRSSLRIKKEGVNAGTLKGKDFIPNPDLAFSIDLSENIPRIELDIDSAIRFLKCENIHFPGLDKGWYLATYKGLGLGWTKVMDSRSNNYFPSNWRILK